MLRSGLAPFEGKVVFVGLQGFVKEFLIQAFDAGFFRLPKAQAVRQYRRRMDNALGGRRAGRPHRGPARPGLPSRAHQGAARRSRVNIKVPLFTVRETRKEFAWLTNYLETVLSNFNWKPITVATIAHEYRRLLEAYADLTGADAAFIDWQAHDFGARLSGPEDSMRAGFAHLCSFTGTDTVAAIDYAEQYYGADSDRELVGGSVPATEHSVMSMGGKLDEIGTFRRLITEVYPSGIVSIVSDTWDFWQVITEYAATLKDEILARAPNALGQAKVVFRPDSGDPVKILTGYLPDELAGDADADGMYTVKDTGGKITEAERKGAVECLWDLFGGDLTAKGFRVLHPRVGLIYGDSITLSRAERSWNACGSRAMPRPTACSAWLLQLSIPDPRQLRHGHEGHLGHGQWRGARAVKDPKTDSGTKSRRWACCASSARAATTCCMIARRPSRRPAACCKTCSSTASWCASTRWPRSAPACATAAEWRRAPGAARWRRRATLSLVENKPVILARRDIRANRGGGIGACGSVPRPLQSSGMTKTATAHERPILTVDVALLALIDQRLHVALAPRAAPRSGPVGLARRLCARRRTPIRTRPPAACCAKLG